MQTADMPRQTAGLRVPTRVRIGAALGLGAALGALAAAPVPGAAAERRILLVAQSPDSFTARGLRALGVAFQQAAPGDWNAVDSFAFDLIVWGFDETREPLRSQGDAMAAFVSGGGVFLGFRATQGSDAWLPVPVQQGKAYQLGDLLLPEHPAMTVPHRFAREHLLQVHGGSIYRAFHSLGDGWIPWVGAGPEQAWDRTAAASAGPHYGIIELPLGAGRIVLVQMIPEYHWFHDTKGDAASAGARLFENLVHYARGQATATAALRPPRRVPEGVCHHWADLLATPGGLHGMPLGDPGWSASAEGPWQRRVDRRGILTMTHPDVPSQPGSFMELRHEVAVPRGSEALLLRWYVTDTYCGGRERILGGARHGETALDNTRKGHRFVVVRVNDTVIWEQDVLGRNPQPAALAIRYADIAAALPRDSDSCTLGLRVEDRLGSGEHPFAIDVFWGCVEVLADLRLHPAARFLDGAGFAADAQGVLRLTAESGTLTAAAGVPPGRYALALRWRDEHTGQSRVSVRADGAEVAAWRLSADDHRLYWAATPVMTLQPGTVLQVEADQHGQEEVALHEAALIPERLLAARPARPATLPDDAPRSLGQPVRFPLTITETLGVPRVGEIAAQGLPFPAGCLSPAGTVRVLDAAGSPLPVQTRPIAHWPDGTVKMLLVAFPASIPGTGRTAYTVEAGPGVPPPPEPQMALTVRRTDAAVVIDTGAMVARLSATHGRIVDSVIRGGQEVKPVGETWDMVIEDEGGRLLRTGGATVTDTEVVEAGPLRALVVRRGKFADAAGRLLDYRLQTEAYAGSDALRVQAWVIHREDDSEHYLRRWTMRLERANAASGRVWISPEESRAAAPGAVLYQHREDTLTWTGADGACRRAPGRAPGQVRLPGFALGMRWWWQRYPQALRFAPDALECDFMPAPFDDGDLPTRWRDRMLELTDRHSVGGVAYPQSPGKLGLHRLAQGQALSQEILFVLDAGAGDAAVRGALAPLDARLRACADPGYASGTRAFGAFHPVDPARFAAYEEGMEGLYRSILAQRESRREYNFVSFGDCTFEWGYGPSYTYWSNSEYDAHHGTALQYLRSGDPRWWELTEQSARQYRDVVIVHHAPSGRLLLGGPRHHNAQSLWMPQHEDQRWVADHTVAGPSAGHSWAEGLVDYWFLTGDPMTEEAVRLLASWYVDVVAADRFGAGGQERGPGWALIAISALASALGDDALMAAGRRVADWICTWQDPLRGVVSVPISEQPSYEGGSTFMHGIVGRGLGRWYDLTGDPRVEKAILGIAAWMTTEPMGEPGTFWYKQSPQNSRTMSATDQCLSALTYAAVLSRDPWYRQVAEALLTLRPTAGRRSASWYPQCLAQLASLRGPLGLAAAEPRLRAGVANAATVTLTAPRDRALAGTVALQADGGVLIQPEKVFLQAEPGGIATAAFTITPPRVAAVAGDSEVVITATLPMDGERQVATCALRLADEPIEAPAALLQAAAFIAQEGGEVQVRTDKVGTVGTSISHWDAAGHRLTWSFELPEAGRYQVVLRYCAQRAARRSVSVDGGPEIVLTLRGTGGFAATANDWAHQTVPGSDGQPLGLDLAPGRHTITLVNLDGTGLNLDYLAVVRQAR